MNTIIASRTELIVMRAVMVYVLTQAQSRLTFINTYKHTTIDQRLGCTCALLMN